MPLFDAKDFPHYEFDKTEAQAIADIANKKLLEDDFKVTRLHNWPITRERYRQVLAKMRRQAKRIKELEERVDCGQWYLKVK